MPPWGSDLENKIILYIKKNLPIHCAFIHNIHKLQQHFCKQKNNFDIL